MDRFAGHVEVDHLAEWKESFSWLRAVLLVLPVWWTIHLGAGWSTWCFLDGVNLAFHEAGHLFFSFGGQTIHLLGGTFGQLLVPALLSGVFLLQRHDPFSAAVCTWWLGESLINIAIYMADARDLLIPLVGGGEHDWNNLFYKFGMLTEGSVVATSTITHMAGVTCMLLGLGWAGLFLIPESIRSRIQEAFASVWEPLGALLQDRSSKHF